MIKNKWVIEMKGNAYPFFIEDIQKDGNPFFCSEIEFAKQFNTQAGARSAIDKLVSAGFTMELVPTPLEVKYTLGVY